MAWHQRVEWTAIRQCYDMLTPREREVMRLVVSGLLTKQIAAKLGSSDITTKVHPGQVIRKMQAASVADLVRMAAELRAFATGEEFPILKYRGCATAHTIYCSIKEYSPDAHTRRVARWSSPVMGSGDAVGRYALRAPPEMTVQATGH